MDQLVRAITSDGMVQAVAVSTRDLTERARQIHTTLPVATAALGRALAAGEGAEAAWRRLAQDLPLPPEDRAALAEAASGLSGDEAQVCRALTAAAERLERSLEAERAASMSIRRTPRSGSPTFRRTSSFPARTSDPSTRTGKPP